MSASIANKYIYPKVEIIKVKPGISFWHKHIDEHYEYDRRLGEWLPLVYYTCALCGKKSIRNLDTCPNCKSVMKGI